MSRFKKITIATIALVAILSPLIWAYAYELPELELDQDYYCTGVGESLYLRVDDVSDAYILSWDNWYIQFAGGATIIDSDESTGYKPNWATAEVQLSNPGRWYMNITAWSDAGSDTDTAWVYVCQPSIDHSATPSSMLCQSPNGATIYYSIEPNSPYYRPNLDLTIENSSHTVVKTANLPSDELGNRSYHWDGKDDNGDWVPPGEYTVIVYMVFGGKTFTDTHTIDVYVEVDIDSILSDSFFFLDANEVAEIYYTTEPSSVACPNSVSLIIEDMDETTVVASIPLSNPFGSGSAIWDGKNLAGIPVDPNTYKAKIQIDFGTPSPTISDRHSVIAKKLLKIEGGTNQWILKGYNAGFSANLDSIVNWYEWDLGDELDRSGNNEPIEDQYKSFTQLGSHTITLDVKRTASSTVEHASKIVHIADMSFGPDPGFTFNGFLPVNDNDDNENGIMDYADTKTWQDSDLIRFNLDVDGSGHTGDAVELGATTACLTVWDDQLATAILSVSGSESERWSANGSSWPHDVWIEGRLPSGPSYSNPHLTWRYKGNILNADLDDAEMPLCGWTGESDEIIFTVVQVDMDLDGVDDNSEEMETEEITPGGFIPLNGTATLTVKPIAPDWVQRSVVLSVENRGDGRIEIWDGGTQISSGYRFSPDESTGKTFTVKGTTTSSNLRDITLVLTHGQTGFRDEINVTVVEVEKVQYKIGTDPYQDCPNPLAVAKGADVTFKAILTPSLALWPTDKPEWSGSSGASGTGEEVEVAFDTASSNPNDYKVVEAECGNTISVNVTVVDLSTLEINANRTTTLPGASAPESSFPVKLGEHFELGNEFKFNLMLGSWPQPVKLRSEIWERDYFDEVIAIGAGASIWHTFGTGDHDDGPCKTRFFFDNNSSGDSETGVTDPYLDSLGFRAQALTAYSLSFAYSSVATVSSASATAACNTATNLILMKDIEDDWRATASLSMGSFASTSIPAVDNTVNPAVVHDPVRLVVDGNGTADPDHSCAYFTNHTTADIYVVQWLEKYDTNGNFVDFIPGFSSTGGPIFIMAAYLNSPTLPHEFGHTCGVGHSTDSRAIMYPDYDSGLNMLEQSDVAAFE